MLTKRPDKKETNKLFKFFGEKLLDLRTKKKLSLEEAACRLNITIQKLNKIERGEVSFAIHLLFEFGVLYDFEPMDFINSYSAL